MPQLQPIVQLPVSTDYLVSIASLGYNSRYASRVQLRAYVKRTGKSQDYLVRHSRIGCAKCGRHGMCSIVWKTDRKDDRNVSLGEYLDEAAL